MFFHRSRRVPLQCFLFREKTRYTVTARSTRSHGLCGLETSARLSPTESSVPCDHRFKEGEAGGKVYTDSTQLTSVLQKGDAFAINCKL